MTTSLQLPVVRDIELMYGSGAVVPIDLGLDLSVFGTYGSDYYLAAGHEGPGFPFQVSILSASAGRVALGVDPYAVTPEITGSPWRLFLVGESAEDPPTLLRTLAWGRVTLVTPKTISAGSPLYHAVEMVAGDEFTFQVNLNTNITGKNLGASLFSRADGLVLDVFNPLTLPMAVVSSATGLVKVTIDESQSSTCVGGGASWWLRDYSSEAVLRAGPVTAYLPTSSAAAPADSIGESVSAAPTPNLGSVFL